VLIVWLAGSNPNLTSLTPAFILYVSGGIVIYIKGYLVYLLCSTRCLTVYNYYSKGQGTHSKYTKEIENGRKSHFSNRNGEEVIMSGNDCENCRPEMDRVIQELEKQGYHAGSHNDGETGLGDVVEAALNKFGVTEEKFKRWFNLRECGCSRRKAWLNNIFSWKKNNGQ